jgi:hypothetical protein
MSEILHFVHQDDDHSSVILSGSEESLRLICAHRMHRPRLMQPAVLSRRTVI